MDHARDRPHPTRSPTNALGWVTPRTGPLGGAAGRRDPPYRFERAFAIYKESRMTIYMAMENVFPRCHECERLVRPRVLPPFAPRLVPDTGAPPS